MKEHLANYSAASAAKLPPLPTVDGGVGGGGGARKQPGPKSFMWEHCRDCHDGVVGDEGGMGDYMFKVSGVFKKCLDRQVDEGLRIIECEKEGGKVLNSKNEWFTPKIVEAVFRQQ